MNFNCTLKNYLNSTDDPVDGKKVMARHYEGLLKEMDKKKTQCNCGEYILEQRVCSQAGLAEGGVTIRKSRAFNENLSMLQKS